MKPVYRRVNKDKVHDVGVMLGEIMDSFHVFFTKIADNSYVSEQEKNEMVSSLEEVRRKIDKILLFAKQL